MTARLEFWFDFASTYSYLSALRVGDAAHARGVPVLWRPFLLGAVFARYGWRDSPFNIFPEKGANMWRDMERECDRLGLPLNRPAIFPQNSMLAARVGCQIQDDAAMPGFVRRVFRMNFVDGDDISDSAVLASALTAEGLEAEPLLQAATEPPAKDALRAQTETAIARGVYGAPSFLVGDELFWGNDRMDRALDWAADSA